MTLRILTFNLRVAFCERGTSNAWKCRRDFCRDIIQADRYDFVGTQETLWWPEDPDIDQGGDLTRGLPAYGVLGDTRDADPARGEGTPVLYRRDRWEPDPEDSGTLWLSETPEVRGSKSWDTTCTRVLVWGRFHELADGERTGRTVVFANTHLDNLYEHTALMQAALCDRLLADRARPGEPVFLTGDFNMYEDSWPIRHLRGEALPATTLPPAPLPLCDAWREVHPGAPDTRTYHGWGGDPEDRRIDYILYSGEGIRVREAQINRIQRDGRFPSDHYPLAATFDVRDSIAP